MIKSLTSSTPYLEVSGGNNYNSFHIDSYKVQQGIAGQVRHNGNDFEINDGSSWRLLGSSYNTNINLSHGATAALDWAQHKMKVEREAESLAASSETVKAALAEYRAILQIAEERLNVVVTLVKEHA
jgi:hypothetical protein